MRVVTLLFLLIIPFVIQAQKYGAESGIITFFSDAALEDIKAENKKVASLFNSSNGAIAFSVPIVEFQFEKSLMQEHFNEKYLESEKYPKASFQGMITDFKLDTVDEQKVLATGKLTIHGVTKDISVPGTFQNKDGKILMAAKFIVQLEDYKVEIPQLMWQNIAEEVEVSLTFIFKAQ
jgi:hypothetical protein